MTSAEFREIREQRRLTQAALAHVLAVSKSTISRYEAPEGTAGHLEVSPRSEQIMGWIKSGALDLEKALEPR